jgi:Leucine Rich repeat
MAEAAATESPPPRRRFRLRFSLRTFLIAFTLIGVFLGWFGRELVRVRRQREVVNQYLASGAKVHFDYQFDGKNFNVATPPAPKILLRMFGDDLFTHLVYVRWDSVSPASDKLVALLPCLPQLKYIVLAGPRVSDRAITYLQKLPQLQELGLYDVGIHSEGIGQLAQCPGLSNISLYGQFVSDAHLKAIPLGDRLRIFQLLRTPNVGDEGVSALANLKGLEYLDIYSAPKVTNSGIAALSQLQHLKSLNILGTAMTDGALPDIGKLTNLEFLRLDGHPISDAGVTALVGLKNLRYLQLLETRITNAAMGTIGKFSELEDLGLSYTQVGDEGLNHLKGLSKLAMLELIETQVTDEGLLQLKDMQSLRYLNVSLGQGVSREGVLRLKQFLPKCQFDCWAPGPAGAGGGEYFQATE